MSLTAHLPPPPPSATKISPGDRDSLLVPIYTPVWREALWGKWALERKNKSQWLSQDLNPDLSTTHILHWINRKGILNPT